MYPHLQYGITTWGNASKTLLTKIFIKQKCVVKTICYQKLQTNSNPLFKKLRMLKLEDIVKLHISKLMFKMQQQTLVGDNRLTKVSSIHNYNTRTSTSSNYFIHRRRTNLGCRSFTVVGPKILTNVPKEIKELNFKQFKNPLKKHLFNKY